MGDYLDGAMKKFKEQNGKLLNPDFWSWVDKKVADDPLKAATEWNPNLYSNAQQQYVKHYLKWFQAGVKYLADKDARERYRVEIRSGKLMRKFDKHDSERTSFSTEKIIKHYKDKGKPASTCIWVMSTDEEFYSHLVKIGRFHHSSLLGGNAIAAGGEWGTNDNGTLQWVNSHSGHYRPEIKLFESALKVLDKHQALSEAQVRLYLYGQKGAHNFEKAVGVADFLNRNYDDKQLKPYYE